MSPEMEELLSKCFKLNWTQDEEDTLLEILKEHGKNYEIMQRALNRTLTSIIPKIYELKKRHAEGNNKDFDFEAVMP